MDWNLAIERNREALKRVLAVLVAMAGLGDRHISPLEGEMSAKPTEGGSGPSRETPPSALPGISPSKGEIARTLPRHLHRAVLRLLRPAESAARRLIIVAAREIVMPLPARRAKPKPDPKAAHAALRGLGIAVVMSRADHARAAAEQRAAEKRAAARAARAFSLPLLDPLPDPLRRRPRYVPAHAAPRILSFGSAAPHRLPPPPSPDDRIDATRLAARLAALGRALDDLPGHARRFARWKARRARLDPPLRNGRGGGGHATRACRLSPLKPGRAPGPRKGSTHEVHEILADLHWFATQALQHPDTS